MAEYVAAARDQERVERERRARGVTFREVATAYLCWLEAVKGAKPATLRQHRSDLAEPDAPYRRGKGRTNGRVMRKLGARPAKAITTREIEELLQTVSESGVSARTTNRVRAVVSAVFTYGMRESTFGLAGNPVTGSDKHREPQPEPLAYYSVEEVESLARALSDGLHRQQTGRSEVEVAEDRQDAELIRVACYAGLRMGELLALRWEDVDFSNSALTVHRALSAGVETSTKNGRVRRVPLSDQTAAALERLSRRDSFTREDEFVFCNLLGRSLDPSALRRRFKRARDVAGLRPLRFHDFRHTFGSLLAASGVDIVTIRDSMGHADLKTSGRYLHARPASEQAAIFTAAFRPAGQSGSRLEHETART